jgi:tRNA (guanine-N7-)-methyltransferase
MQSSRDLIVEPIGLEIAALPRPIDWRQMFGNDNPVELEVGMGKGTFLTDQALARPQTNFFGLEYARWFWRYASDRLRRNGCLNARAVRAEAAFFFREFLAAGSVSVIHVYFPDPWPKKRHQKRRLIQPAFLLEVHRVLAPGGQLRIVTDHADYFQHIQPTLAASPLTVIPYDRPNERPVSADQGELVGTNFERKYRRQGRPFFSTAARRPF